MNGKWVQDTTIVYREGALSGYRHCLVDDRQNCKRNRNDSPYLGYRWALIDKSCEAKRIRFTRKRFLSTVSNKKIAFVGDSLTRNMFQSLACLLYVPFDKKEMVEEHMYKYRYISIWLIFYDDDMCTSCWYKFRSCNYLYGC